MEIAEAQKIDAEREARELREYHAAEALRVARQVEDAKRNRESKLRSLAGEIKEAEDALVAFKAAAGALAPLSEATLARCGAHAGQAFPDAGGAAWGGMHASTVLPIMLATAIAACDERLRWLRDEREALAKKPL